MMLCLQQAPYNSERQLQVIEKETQHLNKFNPHLITEEESPFILSLSLPPSFLTGPNIAITVPTDF